MEVSIVSVSPNNHQQGFTLVEIVVTTVLVSLVVGGAVAGYISFNQRQQVAAVGQEVRQTIIQAQTAARTGVKPAACGGSNLEGFEVATTGTSVTTRVLCGGTSHVYSTYDVTVPGVTLSGESVQFAPLTGRATNSASFSVSRTGESSSFMFDVSQGGGVSTGEVAPVAQQQAQQAQSPTASPSETGSPNATQLSTPTSSPDEIPLENGGDGEQIGPPLEPSELF